MTKQTLDAEDIEAAAYEADTDRVFCDGFRRGARWAEKHAIGPTVEHALGEAVSALYFADDSDYKSALWQIVLDLGGQEVVDLLNQDAQAAYHRYAANRNAKGTA